MCDRWHVQHVLAHVHFHSLAYCELPCWMLQQPFNLTLGGMSTLAALPNALPHCNPVAAAPSMWVATPACAMEPRGPPCPVTPPAADRISPVQLVCVWKPHMLGLQGSIRKESEQGFEAGQEPQRAGRQAGSAYTVPWSLPLHHNTAVATPKAANRRRDRCCTTASHQIQHRPALTCMCFWHKCFR